MLRVPAALDALLDAVGGCDRLVLLGDVVELLEGRRSTAMDVAEPILRAIGGAARGEIVLVPGNHDGALVRRWVRARAERLDIDTPVPADATPALARVVAWLGPERVRVHYPGVWLSERVWATHGHYLDRHLLPERAYGVARGLFGRLPRDGAIPGDYESAGGPSISGIEAALTSRLPAPLAGLLENTAERLRAATMPQAVQRRLVRRQTSAVTSRLLSLQMRRAAIPALARVVHRLGVEAEFVVFGHVHRCGPLPGDDPRQWAGPLGAPRIANCGSWVYEGRLLHHAEPPHPYWPGGALVLDEGGEPRAMGLLDHLGAPVLDPRRR